MRFVGLRPRRPFEIYRRKNVHGLPEDARGGSSWIAFSSPPRLDITRKLLAPLWIAICTYFARSHSLLIPKSATDSPTTAERKKLVNQVGYHYRFVAAFNEAKRLLDRQLIGELHHIRAEAYGPVVLRPKGTTWRSQKSEGGGCLFDYSCHAIDLLNYLVGRPIAVSGSVLNSVFLQ